MPISFLRTLLCTLALTPVLSAAADQVVIPIELVTYQGNVDGWARHYQHASGSDQLGMMTWLIYVSGQPWKTPMEVVDGARSLIEGSPSHMLAQPYIGCDIGLILGRIGSPGSVAALDNSLRKGLADNDYVTCRNASGGLAMCAALGEVQQLPVLDYAIRLLTRVKGVMATDPLDQAGAGTIDVLYAAIALQKAMEGGVIAADLGSVWNDRQDKLLKHFAAQQRLVAANDPNALAKSFQSAIAKAENSLKLGEKNWAKVVDAFSAWKKSGYWTVKRIVVAIIGINTPLIETQKNDYWVDLKACGRRVGESVNNASRNISNDQTGQRLASLAATQVVARLATQGDAPAPIQAAAVAFLAAVGDKDFIGQAMASVEESEDTLRTIRRWSQYRDVVDTAINEKALPLIEEDRTRPGR